MVWIYNMWRGFLLLLFFIVFGLSGLFYKGVEKMKTIILVIVGAFLISGCAAGNPTKRELGGLLGAASGAGLGAVIGNQSGNLGKGAAIGGVAGGLGGLLLGDQLQGRDQQQSEQEQQLHEQQLELDILKRELELMKRRRGEF